MESGQNKIMCPSSRAKVGSEILGVRQEDGTIAILPKPLPVTSQFIESVNEGVKAEQRFRFTNKCVESGCKQWNGKACGIAEELVKFMDIIPINLELPECAIRSDCRWHLQKGDDACKMCTYVITEVTEEEIEEYKRNNSVY